MSDSTQPPRIRVQTPGDLTELVPYMLGFTPQESLVILVLQDREVQVTARTDIADVEPPGAAEHLLDRIWRRYPDADAYLVAYTEQPDSGWTLLRRCAAYLPFGTGSQTMVVSSGTWQSPDGEHGTVRSSGPLAEGAARLGLHRFERRADLEAAFATVPDSETLTAQVDAVLGRLPAPGETTAIISRTGELLRHNLPTTEPTPQAALAEGIEGLSVEDAIQLAILVQNPHASDLALLSITNHDAHAHLQLWRSVVNRIPEFGAEQPLFLAGMAAWIGGDGACASIALSRSQAVAAATDGNGRARPSDLLDQLIDQVTSPSTWARMRLAVLAQSDQRVRDAVTAVRRSSPEPEPPRSRRPDTELGTARRKPVDPGLAL